MEWNQLFLRKEEWQKNTFYQIKNDLVSARGSRFLRYENAEERHLVMVYGKSQVGKTTVILNMIGIKDEYFQEVYDTLRAGVPRGNSSTSTSIIYSKSSTNMYGCSWSSVNDLSDDILFFNKEGIVDYLIDIRKKVEKNEVNSDRVLFLYIPKQYFIDDPTANSISIMDMPGIESRNQKESVHLQNLMTMYIPISAVCIIVCRSNEIQSLETIELPNSIDWKRMGHRFILVITNAYSDGERKKYFDTSRNERKTDFYEYVNATYNKEIRKILGENNRIEVFPVDVGNSADRLCTQEIKNQEDVVEIVETKKRTLAELRKAIVSRKGEKLKAALLDLKCIVDHYGEDELRWIEESINDYKQKIEYYLHSQKELEEFLLTNKEANLDEIIIKLSDMLHAVKKEFQLFQQGYVDGETYDCCKDVYSIRHELFRFVDDRKLKKPASGSPWVLRDDNKEVLEKLKSEINDKINMFIKKIKDKIKEYSTDEKCFDNTESIQKPIENLIYDKEKRLYPSKNGFFSKKPRVTDDDFYNCCIETQEELTQIIKDEFKYDKWLTEKNRDLEEKKELARQLALYETRKNKNETQIEQYKQEIQTLMNSIEEICEKKRQDQKILDMYLDHAKRAYLNQRESLISQINETQSPGDKVLLLLLLGLVDEDYQKVTGGLENGIGRTVKKRSKGIFKWLHCITDYRGFDKNNNGDD